ncbi:MAG: methyltransferase domain-containing protein [Pseudohongiella sp.]|nr:methyltransferase domain-containing protein [Pseudohongiella sp.]
MRNPSALACPMDGLPLERTGNSWQCPNAHSYDIARLGYVHLLPVQNKRSRDPGDSKEMVLARQQFLAAGFYKPIADAVCEAVRSRTDADSLIAVLDAGCGEGYYLRELQQSGLQLHVTGLDISKWAVIAAAKPDKTVNWLVGSNANLPLLPATQDVVLCMFGFPVYAEFARVLKEGGVLVKVDAGPDHLLELREIIYPAIRTPGNNKAEAPAQFTALEQRSLRYTINASGQEQIARLLTMTPHLYRTSAEGRARATALTEIELTVDVRIEILEKAHAPITSTSKQE